MWTLVIVKTRIDRSLNLYEHCVACDDESNCPAGPARGAAYLAYTVFDLRCTPLFEVLKHFETRCTTTFCLQRWPAAVRTAPFYQQKCAQKAKQVLFGVFWGYLAVPRKKTRFRPILTYFEAIFGLHLLWGVIQVPPSKNTVL